MPIDTELKPPFPRKTPVEKVSGYRFPGIVLAALTTSAGELRYVVECTAPEVAGCLHIFAPEQIRERSNG